MDTNVRLRYNGEITWDAPAITKSSCVVDVSYFPFDSQECNLTFGSWTYNGNQVRDSDFDMCGAALLHVLLLTQSHVLR